MKKIITTLLFVSVTISLNVMSVFATTHYEITTSSSIADESYSDYSQSGSGEAAYGGVFYIGNNGDLTLDNVDFYNNRSSRGGAVYIYNNRGSLNLTDVFFDSNSATYGGGAIYNQRGTITVGAGAIFTDNKASSSSDGGGAIYNSGNLYISSNVVFSGNRATSGSGKGGAIYNASNGKIEIGDGVKFSSNTAGLTNSTNGYAGAIYLYSNSNMTIGNNAEFDSNTTGMSGGAIYIGSESRVTIGDNAKFTNSRAYAGGAIYNNGYTTIGANANFSSNYGTYVGGVIYNNSGRLTIKENAIFENNYAASSSGAIYILGGVVTIEDGAKFLSNTSTSDGAICNWGTLNLMAKTNDVEFTGNKVRNKFVAIYNATRGVVNLFASSDANIIFNDRIAGTNIININNSTSSFTANGKIILNEDMSEFKGTVNIYGGEVELQSKAGTNPNINTNKFFSGTLNISSGTLNIMNNAIDNIALSTFTSTENTNLKIDANLIDNTSDNFTVTNTITESELNITEINLLGSRKDAETGTLILFKNGNSPVLNALTTASYAGYTYSFTSGDIAGTLNYIVSGRKTFKDFVNDTENEIRSFSFAVGGETVTEDLGDLGGTQFTVFGNGNDLVANSVAGINVSSGQTLNIENIKGIKTFSNDGDGGFLYNNGGNINLRSDISFNSNSANNGGAIYNSGILTIGDNVNFIANSATSEGGAVYNNEGTINLVANTKNIEFTGNTANGISNAIHDNNGTINLWTAQNTNIIFNDAITSENNSSIININQSTTTSTAYGRIILNGDMSGYTGTVNIYGGEVELLSQTEEEGDINPNKFFSGTINLNNGTINVLNYAVDDNIEMAALNATGNANLKFDADLNNNTSDNFTIANCTGTLNLIAINLLGTDEDSGQITLFNNEKAPEINILTTGNYGGYEYTFTNSDVAGVLNYEKTGLTAKTFKEYVNTELPLVRSYSLAEDEIVTEDLYDLGGDQLTVFGNGYNITTENYRRSGIFVDEGKTLNIENVNNYGGFYGAIYNYGTVNISGTNFTDNNGEDIINDGTLILSGTASTFESGISGYDDRGTTIIDGVDIDLGDMAYIAQKSIIINDDAGLTANASNTIGEISNEGSLIFTGGTNSNKINGNGQLYINGDVTNTAQIKQSAVEIDGLLENKYLITTTDMYINGVFIIGKNGSFYDATNSIIEDGSSLDFRNNNIQRHNFKNLTINSGAIDLYVDADLLREKMDTISADSNSEINGTINIKSINILKDNKDVAELLLTNSSALKDKITTTNIAKSKLYMYEVSYDNGYLKFINANNPLINPAVIEQAVASSVGGAAAQSAVFEQAFMSLDTEAINIKRSKSASNLYASATDQIFLTENSIERGLWLRPFMLQDTVKIGDYDVDNNLYGTLAGIDWPVQDNILTSFYLGYVGSNQKYDEIKMNQTGYVVGATGMLVKENYYVGLTANMIFNKASADTDDGTDAFDMNMFSVGIKGGYNFDIGNNWLLEPNLALMYGSLSAQGYETSRGAQIDSQSTSNIVIQPQVKAKWQLDNGWQPYGLLGYVANLNDNPTVVADSLEFELDKVDGYVEYGVGINKDFVDTAWSCYGQLTGRNGGRSGFAGNFGIKYRF